MDASFRKYPFRHVFPVNCGDCSHIAVTVAHHTETKMRAEKRRDDHADAVVHPSCRPELPHARVDDRDAGPSLLPGLEVSLVRLASRKVVEIVPEVLRRHVGKRMERMMGELPPAQFRAVLARAGPGTRYRVPDPGDADLAMAEVGGEHRGSLSSRNVAVFRIALEAIVDEGLQSFERCRGTG